MHSTDTLPEQTAQQAFDLGFAYEQIYRGCAQCTLAAIQDAFNLPDEDLFRAASALASGGGLTCAGSCGGFSGGLLFIGGLLGRRRAHIDDDNEFKYLSFALGRKLHDRFIETYGSVVCSEIHRNIFGRTYDMQSSDDKRQFNDDGAHIDKCTTVVANAARWTVQIIYDELAERNLLPPACS